MESRREFLKSVLAVNRGRCRISHIIPGSALGADGAVAPEREDRNGSHRRGRAGQQSRARLLQHSGRAHGCDLPTPARPRSHAAGLQHHYGDKTADVQLSRDSLRRTCAVLIAT